MGFAGEILKSLQAGLDAFPYLNETNVELDRAGGAISAEDRKKALETLGSMDDVLGLLDLARQSRQVDETTEDWIREQVMRREEARKARDFAMADAIRDELADRGVVLEDSAEGTRWKVVK